MAHRAIGQERFGFADRMRTASSLDEIGKLIDWQELYWKLGDDGLR